MHKTNRKAFYDIDAGHRLFRLYSRLVALELTLKDHDPANRKKEHDIGGMVAELKLPGRAALTPLTVALGSALNALWCTMRNGTAGPIDLKFYPGVRYLRHETDFAGGSKDTDLDKAIQALEALWKELRHQGINP